MLVHRRVTLSIKFAGTHLHTWVDRGTVRVKCLAQEHNTMSPARARTRTACSGVERINHEATAPPTCKFMSHTYCTSRVTSAAAFTVGSLLDQKNKCLSVFKQRWTLNSKLSTVLLERHSYQFRGMLSFNIT